MESLSDNQVNQVYDLLLSHGLTYEVLRDELLDHICCMVESEMSNGQHFTDALEHAEKQFGPLGIERTQEATIYLLTLKLKKMKKTASILGIIGGICTIFGSLFKVMHWPFASVLLLCGLGVTSLLFMPTALYVNYKTKEGVRDKATIATGFIGGFLLMVFALFKVMHWPGASMIMLIALMEIIFVFIPLYYIKSYRNPDNKWFDIGSLTVILAAIIMVLTLYRVGEPSGFYIQSVGNLEQNTINTYNRLNEQIEKKSQAIMVQKPQLANKIEQISLLRKLISQSFYQFRNQLLDNNYEADFSRYNETLAKLNASPIIENEKFKTLIKALSQLNESELYQKGASIPQSINMYTLMVNEIAETTISTEPLQNLAKNLAELQISTGNQSQFNMLIISYLNLTDLDMLNFELAILELL